MTRVMPALGGPAADARMRRRSGAAVTSTVMSAAQISSGGQIAIPARE